MNLKIVILTGGLPAYRQDPRTDEHTGLSLKQENKILKGNLLKHDFNSMNICIRQAERGIAQFQDIATKLEAQKKKISRGLR
jgi:hypothetical protein